MASGTPKSQQRRESPCTPLSPSLLSRKDEKDQMVNLNNRMAVYVEKVRSLESENANLKVQITNYENSGTREVDTMKAMYEAELAEARRLLDELSKEKAQLQLESSSYQDKYEAERVRADGLQHDNEVLEKKIKDLSALISTKDSQFVRVKRERDDYCTQVENLKGKLADLKEELDSTHKLMEAETIQRVDMENKLQSVKEELLFKERLFNEELNELKRRSAVTVTQFSEQTKGDYENKLEAAIIDLRDQQNADLEALREELEAQYDAKLANLQKQLDAARKVNLKGKESTRSSEVKVERLQATIRSMQTQIREKFQRKILEVQEKNNDLNNRLRDLEGQIETEREVRLNTVIAIEKERDDAKQTVARMEKEFSELQDVKLQLDHEISIYRKLLEEEENRLNLSPNQGSTGVKGRTRRKRKRGGAPSEGETRSKKQGVTVISETVTIERTQRKAAAGREDVLHEQAVPLPEGSNSCLVM